MGHQTAQSANAPHSPVALKYVLSIPEPFLWFLWLHAYMYMYVCMYIYGLCKLALGMYVGAECFFAKGYSNRRSNHSLKSLCSAVPHYTTGESRSAAVFTHYFT